MKILIAGSSGFIASQLAPDLGNRGHQVIRLVRDPTRLSQNTFFWNPERGEIDLNAFSDVDAVINLSGANISEKRWTQKWKEEILQSRIQATSTLASAISKLNKAPEVFIQTSAVGFYGDRGEEICTEHTSNGEGFLSDVCCQWEKAASPPIRTVILRLGAVLSPRGGVLRKILPLFKWGLGGKLGSGKQYMSWIAIDDLLSIFQFVLTHKNIDGVINAVSPSPVTNAIFTETLSDILHRPAWFPIPSCLLRLLLGKEMANEVLLSSTRVEPLRLKSFGHPFQYPTLLDYLSSLYPK